MTAPSDVPADRRLPSDVVAGGVLGGLGVYIVLTAVGWTILDVDGPGPGFFPLFYGVGLVAGSLALSAGGLRRRPRPDLREVDRSGLVRALSMWAVFALTVVLMQFVGFAIALALLIVFFTRVIFPRSIRFTAIAAVLTPLAFHLIFTVLLGVALPVGRLTGF